MRLTPDPKCEHCLGKGHIPSERKELRDAGITFPCVCTRPDPGYEPKGPEMVV